MPTGVVLSTAVVYSSWQCCICGILTVGPFGRSVRRKCGAHDTRLFCRNDTVLVEMIEQYNALALVSFSKVSTNLPNHTCLSHIWWSSGHPCTKRRTCPSYLPSENILRAGVVVDAVVERLLAAIMPLLRPVGRQPRQPPGRSRIVAIETSGDDDRIVVEAVCVRSAKCTWVTGL